MLNAVAGKELPIYGHGMNIRDWLHVDDHVTALRSIAERGRAGETYLIGARAEMRNIDLACSICRLLDARHPESGPHARLISFVADRPGHDARYAIDPGKIERELGWRPRYNFEQGLGGHGRLVSRQRGVVPAHRRRVSAGTSRRPGGGVRLLILGAGGQVGRALARRAGTQGQSLVRSACDITNRGAVAQALSTPELSAVVNCAAYTAVDRAESERELAFAVNAEGARIVARGAANRGLPVIHLSTDYVYAGTGTARLASRRRADRAGQRLRRL